MQGARDRDQVQEGKTPGSMPGFFLEGSYLSGGALASCAWAAPGSDRFEVFAAGKPQELKAAYVGLTSSGLAGCAFCAFNASASARLIQATAISRSAFLSRLFMRPASAAHSRAR